MIRWQVTSWRLLKKHLVTVDGKFQNRTSGIPKSDVPDESGRIIRSPDALQALTLLILDSKVLTCPVPRAEGRSR